MNDRISVIMPAYNCEKYVSKAIRSILDQTYSNFELLICDDASSDNTVDAIREFRDPRLQIFMNESNKGVVYTKNKLIERSIGTYITTQDADDWSHDARLELQLAAIKNTDCKASATNYYTYYNGNKILTDSGEEDFVISREFKSPFPFAMASVMYSRKLVKLIGFYESFFIKFYAEDLYWTNSLLQNSSIYYISDPLYFYRYHPGSLTNGYVDEARLFSVELVNELIDQKKITGTNWLEKREYNLINDFLNQLIYSESKLSEKYRILAAKKVDFCDFSSSLYFLYKSARLNPFSYSLYRTTCYLIRKYLEKHFNFD